MGVGVPLGVLIVLCVAYFLINEHRLRIKAEKTVVNELAAHNESHRGWMREENHQWKGHPGPLGFGNTQTQPGELFEGEVHEVS